MSSFIKRLFKLKPKEKSKYDTEELDNDPSVNILENNESFTYSKKVTIADISIESITDESLRHLWLNYSSLLIQNNDNRIEKEESFIKFFTYFYETYANMSVTIEGHPTEIILELVINLLSSVDISTNNSIIKRLSQDSFKYDLLESLPTVNLKYNSSLSIRKLGLILKCLYIISLYRHNCEILSFKLGDNFIDVLYGLLISFITTIEKYYEDMSVNINEILFYLSCINLIINIIKNTSQIGNITKDLSLLDFEWLDINSNINIDNRIDKSFLEIHHNQTFHSNLIDLLNEIILKKGIFQLLLYLSKYIDNFVSNLFSDGNNNQIFISNVHINVYINLINLQYNIINCIYAFMNNDSIKYLQSLDLSTYINQLIISLPNQLTNYNIFYIISYRNILCYYIIYKLQRLSLDTNLNPTSLRKYLSWCESLCDIGINLLPNMNSNNVFENLNGCFMKYRSKFNFETCIYNINYWPWDSIKDNEIEIKDLIDNNSHSIFKDLPNQIKNNIGNLNLIERSFQVLFDSTCNDNYVTWYKSSPQYQIYYNLFNILLQLVFHTSITIDNYVPIYMSNQTYNKDNYLYIIQTFMTIVLNIENNLKNNSNVHIPYLKIFIIKFLSIGLSIEPNLTTELITTNGLLNAIVSNKFIYSNNQSNFSLSTSSNVTSSEYIIEILHSPVGIASYQYFIDQTLHDIVYEFLYHYFTFRMCSKFIYDEFNSVIVILLSYQPYKTTKYYNMNYSSIYQIMSLIHLLYIENSNIFNENNTFFNNILNICIDLNYKYLYDIGIKRIQPVSDSINKFDDKTIDNDNRNIKLISRSLLLDLLSDLTFRNSKKAWINIFTQSIDIYKSENNNNKLRSRTISSNNNVSIPSTKEVKKLDVVMLLLLDLKSRNVGLAIISSIISITTSISSDNSVISTYNTDLCNHLLHKLFDVLSYTRKYPISIDSYSQAAQLFKLLCHLCIKNKHLINSFMSYDMISHLFFSINQCARLSNTDVIMNLPDDSKYEWLSKRVLVIRQSFSLITILLTDNKYIKNIIYNNIVIKSSVKSDNYVTNNSNQILNSVSSFYMIDILVQVETIISIETILILFEMMLEFPVISDRSIYLSTVESLTATGLFFDDSDRPKIKNHAVIYLLIKLFPYIIDKNQIFIINTLINLVNGRASLVNLSIYCQKNPTLLDLLVEIIPITNEIVLDQVIILITIIGKYSVSVSQIKSLFSILKLNDNKSLRYNYTGKILQAIKGMYEEYNGPQHSFIFDGNKSGLLLPTILQWPSKKGIAFSVWLRIESPKTSQHQLVNNIINKGNNLEYRPYIFCFRTPSGHGLELSLKSQSENLNTFRISLNYYKENNDVVSFSKELKGMLVYEGIWHFLSVSISNSKNEASLMLDEQYCKDRFPYNGMPNNIIYPIIGDCLQEFQLPNLNTNLRGEMSTMYFFSDPLSEGQMRSIQALGPTYFYCFETDSLNYRSVYSNLSMKKQTVDPSTILDGTLNSQVILNLNPAVYIDRQHDKTSIHSKVRYSDRVTDKYILDNTSINSSIKWKINLSNNLFYNIQSFGCLMFEGTYRSMKYSINTSMHSLGGILVLLPILTQINFPKQIFQRTIMNNNIFLVNKSVDKTIDKVLLLSTFKLINTLLDNSIECLSTLKSINGFKLIGHLLENIPKYYFTVDILRVIIAIYNKLVYDPISQYTCIDNILCNFIIWNNISISYDNEIKYNDENYEKGQSVSNSKLLEDSNNHKVNLNIRQEDKINIYNDSYQTQEKLVDWLIMYSKTNPGLLNSILSNQRLLYYINEYYSPNIVFDLSTNSYKIVSSSITINYPFLQVMRKKLFELLYNLMTFNNLILPSDITYTVSYIMNSSSSTYQIDGLNYLLTLLSDDNPSIPGYVLLGLATNRSLLSLLSLHNNSCVEVRLLSCCIYCKVIYLSNIYKLLPSIPSRVGVSNQTTNKSDELLPYACTLDALGISVPAFLGITKCLQAYLLNQIFNDNSRKVQNIENYNDCQLLFICYCYIYTMIGLPIDNLCNDIFIFTYSTNRLSHSVQNNFINNDIISYSNINDKLNNFKNKLNSYRMDIISNSQICVPALFLTLIDFVSSNKISSYIKLSILVYFKSIVKESDNCNDILKLKYWYHYLVRIIVNEHKQIELFSTDNLTTIDHRKPIEKSEGVIDICESILIQMSLSSFIIGKPNQSVTFYRLDECIYKDTKISVCITEIMRRERLIGMTVSYEIIQELIANKLHSVSFHLLCEISNIFINNDYKDLLNSNANSHYIFIFNIWFYLSVLVDFIENLRMHNTSVSVKELNDLIYKVCSELSLINNLSVLNSNQSNNNTLLLDRRLVEVGIYWLEMRLIAYSLNSLSDEDNCNHQQFSEKSMNQSESRKDTNTIFLEEEKLLLFINRLLFIDQFNNDNHNEHNGLQGQFISTCLLHAINYIEKLDNNNLFHFSICILIQLISKYNQLWFNLFNSIEFDLLRDSTYRLSSTSISLNREAIIQINSNIDTNNNIDNSDEIYVILNNKIMNEITNRQIEKSLKDVIIDIILSILSPNQSSNQPNSNIWNQIINRINEQIDIIENNYIIKEYNNLHINKYNNFTNDVNTTIQLDNKISLDFSIKCNQISNKIISECKNNHQMLDISINVDKQSNDTLIRNIFNKLENDRGPWGNNIHSHNNSKNNNIYWKLDKLHTDKYMYPRLIRNYDGSNHNIASSITKGKLNKDNTTNINQNQQLLVKVNIKMKLNYHNDDDNDDDNITITGSSYTNQALTINNSPYNASKTVNAISPFNSNININSTINSTNILHNNLYAQKMLTSIVYNKNNNNDSNMNFNRSNNGSIDIIDDEMYQCPCEIITNSTTSSGSRNPGILKITKSKLIFQRILISQSKDKYDLHSDNSNLTNQEDKSLNRLSNDDYDFINKSNNTQFLWAVKCLSNCYWNLSDVVCVSKRRYQLRPIALEIIFHSRITVFFNIFNKNNMKKLYKLLLNQKYKYKYFKTYIQLYNKNTNNYLSSGLLNQTSMISYDTTTSDILKILTNQWVNRELSNYDYLLQLNYLSGRSFNDLAQYPIFPWILADYTSKQLDFKNPSSYRNFSYLMNAQLPSQREILIEKYNNLLQFDQDSPPYHNGSHYSTSGFVMWYLLRMEPFTSYHIWLQDGKFDHPDRLFHSIANTYHNCIHSTMDMKELIPEFFYNSIFLENINKVDLGVMQTGDVVDDVILPPWAKDNEDFIRIHREALESDYVSLHLNEWIDLIFGYKQRPPYLSNGDQSCIDHLNSFIHWSYPGAFDLDECEQSEPALYQTIIKQIENFGQVPNQLFNKPHPKRLTFDKINIIFPIASIVDGIHTILPIAMADGNSNSVVTPIVIDKPKSIICYEVIKLSNCPIVYLFEIINQDKLITIDTCRCIASHTFKLLTPDVVPPYIFKIDQLLYKPNSNYISNSKDRRIGIQFASKGLLYKYYSHDHHHHRKLYENLINTKENKDNYLQYEIDRMKRKGKVDKSTSITPINVNTNLTPINEYNNSSPNSTPKSIKRSVSSKVQSLDLFNEFNSTTNDNNNQPIDLSVNENDSKKIKKSKKFSIDNYSTTTSANSNNSTKYFTNYADEHISSNLFDVLSDYKLIFTCGHWDNSFRISNIETSKLIQSICIHNDVVTCLSIASDFSNYWLITGSRDCTIIVWELNLQAVNSNAVNNTIITTPLHILHGHDDAIISIAVNCEYDLICSGSEDGTIILYSLRNGLYIRSIIFGISNDLNSHVKLPIHLLRLTKNFRIVGYSQYNNILCTYTINGKLLSKLETNERLFSILLSEDHNVLLTGGERCLVVMRWVENLMLANTGPRKSFDTIIDGYIEKAANSNYRFQSSIRSLYLTSNERLLIVGLESGEIRILAQDSEYLRRRLHRKLIDIGIAEIR